MTTSTALPGFVVRDAVPLPGPRETVVARAARADTYRIHVVEGVEALLGVLGRELAGAAVALLADENVEALYGREIIDGLRDRGVDVIARTIPSGEASKSLERAVELWDWLARSDLARRDVVVN